MVLCHPDLVESHLVQHLHLLEHPAVELRLWPVQGWDIRGQVVGSELLTRALVLERLSITRIQECTCTSLSAGHDNHLILTIPRLTEPVQHQHMSPSPPLFSASERSAPVTPRAHRSPRSPLPRPRQG